MKKLLALLVVCAMVFVQASSVFAFSKEAVSVGFEYGLVEQDVESTTPIGLSASITDGTGTIASLGAALTYQVDDVKLEQYLVNAGYTINEYLTPYILLGFSSLKFHQTLRGSAYTTNFSGATDLATSGMHDASSFTYGLGMRGKLVTLPAAINIVYDVRTYRFDTKENTNVALLPSFASLSLPMTSKVEYVAWSAAFIADREFVMSKKYLKSVSPYIGYRYTNVAMNIKNGASFSTPIGASTLGIDVTTDQNTQSDLHSLLLGVTAKITEDVSASLGASFFGEQGIAAKVMYSF